MKVNTLPSIDYLKECFSLIDDALVWKARPSYHFESTREHKISNTRWSGKVAGTDLSGYRVVTIDWKQYKVHRIIFYLHHGWVPAEIDHIDGNTFNNAKNNLRAATSSQNNANSRKSVRNKSGVKGVSWDKVSNKWRAVIGVNRRSIHLGRFNSIRSAAKAYKQASELYFGVFGRTE